MAPRYRLPVTMSFQAIRAALLATANRNFLHRQPLVKGGKHPGYRRCRKATC
jgi:hypothetical protein